MSKSPTAVAPPGSSPAQASSRSSFLSWDRRQPDPSTRRALSLLEHAARYLILDKMQPDRVYSAGALPAVTLLWNAADRVRALDLDGQRHGRLVASWLPRHAAARRDRSDAAPSG